MARPRRLSIVLFNLGGPDGPAAVRPFLFNLFSDPAIIALPPPFRQLLAWLISTRRAKSARANYDRMGGASPLLPETLAQARALEATLAARYPIDAIKVEVAMRYWTPTVEDAAQAVKTFAPEEVVLLPLYPQFSTTTTQSALKAWSTAYKGPGNVRAVCCYPAHAGLIAAHAKRIREALAKVPKGVKTRLLFSAHGLPQKVIDGGDPYQRQIEKTAAAVAEALGGKLDWQVCYQSRVGPLAWIGPSTLEAIKAAAEEGLGVVVSPIAFVSEHIETLVELDHDYALAAETAGCPAYVRAAALGTEAAFIEALSDLTVQALTKTDGSAPGTGWTKAACGPICPAKEQTA